MVIIVSAVALNRKDRRLPPCSDRRFPANFAAGAGERPHDNRARAKSSASRSANPSLAAAPGILGSCRLRQNYMSICPCAGTSRSRNRPTRAARPAALDSRHDLQLAEAEHGRHWLYGHAAPWPRKYPHLQAGRTMARFRRAAQAFGEFSSPYSTWSVI